MGSSIQGTGVSGRETSGGSDDERLANRLIN